MHSVFSTWGQACGVLRSSSRHSKLSIDRTILESQVVLLSNESDIARPELPARAHRGWTRAARGVDLRIDAARRRDEVDNEPSQSRNEFT